MHLPSALASLAARMSRFRPDARFELLCLVGLLVVLSTFLGFVAFGNGGCESSFGLTELPANRRRAAIRT